MTVALKLLTIDNYYECLKLKVKEGQESFVAANAFSMAQGQFYPGMQMRAIYAGETMVGFIMWAWDPDQLKPEMWVWRLMIADDHQGKGYGRAAMKHVITLLKIEGITELFLSFGPKNTGGAQFYAGLGFGDTGRVEHDEIVVRLDLTAEN